MATANNTGADGPEPCEDDGLYALLPSWQLRMEAKRLADKTIILYMLGVRSLREWCRERGEPFSLSQDLVLRYMVDRMETGALVPSTVASYLKGIKAFAKWCLAEGELTVNELSKIPEPRPDETILPSVTAEMWDALVATCERDTLRGLRDRAIFGVLRDTGSRAHELLGIKLSEVSMRERTILLHGKGGRDRLVAFSNRTAVDLDRYVRARRKSKYGPGSEWLWLSVSGPALKYMGLRNMILRRASLAGLPEITPHWFRRMFALEALDLDMSPSDLKMAGGWRSYTMVEHYTREHAGRRALQAQREAFERRDG